MRRSNFLVHWTGRDIHTQVASLADNHRRQYAERLIDILIDGFWMTRPREELRGGHVASSGGAVEFTYETCMTCFTELRLSASRDHATSFGLLGIGVTRRYVLDRFGCPVHYVRNSGNERIVGEFARLRYLLNKMKQRGEEGAEAGLEYANYLGTFFKAMSSQESDDFSHINEREWRVVVTQRQIEEGRIVQTGQEQPRHRLLIPPSELRILVFPDGPTRSTALATSRLRQILSGAQEMPVLLTIDECAQF